MKRIVESYGLIAGPLPMIPVPHDCVIRKIDFQGGWLTLLFQEDIATHDAIASIHPDEKTLTMKIHLTDREDAELLAYEHRATEDVYVVRDWEELLRMPKKAGQLEYLYHKVAPGAIQIELSGNTYYIVRLYADQIVLEWQTTLGDD